MANGKRKKFTKREIERIVAKEMPSYRVVEQKPADIGPAPRADVTSPSLAELRRKYLGADAVSEAAAMGRDAAEAEGEESEEPDTMVVVEPKKPEDRLHGAGQKVIMLSRDGKIIGGQG